MQLIYPKVSFRQINKSKAATVIRSLDLSEDEVNVMSLELYVTEETSPIFLIHGMADRVVPVQESILLAEACANNGVDCEVHLFQNGGHGVTNEGCNKEDIMNSLYVYDQIYEAVKAMTEDKFKKYSSLFGSLRKNMLYDEFVQTVLKETMNRLYISALGMDSAAMEAVETYVPLEKNNSAALWLDMVDNWIRLIAKGS